MIEIYYFLIPQNMFNCLTLLTYYLCPVDINSCRFTCRKYYNACPPPNYNILIKNELSKYVPYVDEFIENMRKHKCVIAGSFILSILYGGVFDYYDIDVFEFIDYTENIDSLTDRQIRKVLVDIYECCK